MVSLVKTILTSGSVVRYDEGQIGTVIRTHTFTVPQSSTGLTGPHALVQLGSPIGVYRVWVPVDELAPVGRL